MRFICSLGFFRVTAGEDTTARSRAAGEWGVCDFALAALHRNAGACMVEHARTYKRLNMFEEPEL